MRVTARERNGLKESGAPEVVDITPVFISPGRGPSDFMTRLWFESFLLPQGWAERVQIDIVDGRVQSIEAGSAPGSEAERHAIGVPGLPNVHSHAFQRGMAGLTEVAGLTGDNFWSWRETMYRFVADVSPDDMENIAAFAYMEMLESGFTRVGEFHYVHHDRGGRPYSNPAEMATRIAAAAGTAGIGLTLLPAFYAHSGFGALAPGPGQSRFINDLDSYDAILDRSRQAVARLDDAVVGVAPHSLRAVTPPELQSVIRLAGEAPVHIHVAEQAQEVEDCLHWCGRRPAQWLLDACDVNDRWCLVHATHVDDRELDRIAASGATVGLCPITEANLGDGIFPAAQFLLRAGSFGIGTDSNVLIDPAQELRMLEYAQRLVHQSRNQMTRSDGRSTGRTLFDCALQGGLRALGIPSGGLCAGSAADLIALDSSHEALAARRGDAILDAWIFAGRRPAVDCVWRYGKKVVADGRHARHASIGTQYRATIGKLLSV
jgi:formiminoglutamate deiminase